MSFNNFREKIEETPASEEVTSRPKKKRKSKNKSKIKKLSLSRRAEEIIEVDFENNTLQNAQLEYLTLVHILTNEDLKNRLWPRLTEEHFSSTPTVGIYKRLSIITSTGKEFPSLAVMAIDPALPDSSREYIKATLQRADAGLPLTRSTLIIDEKEYKIEDPQDFEGHVFDLLDSYKFTRIAADKFTTAIETVTNPKNLNPLDNHRVFEDVAQTILEINSVASITDTITHVGAGATDEDFQRIQEVTKSMFSQNKLRFKTGNDKYDAETGGFQAPEVVVVGASTGGGKTAFMLSTMVNMLKLGTSTAMLQLELSREQVHERISANIANVEGDLIRTGKIRDMPKEQKEIEEAWEDLDDIGKMNNARMTMFTPPSCTVQGCEFVFKTYPYRVWFVDYINLIRIDGGTTLEWSKLGLIVKQFKALAKKYAITVVLAAQVNIDKETGRIDTRYSGAIKEDCDVFFAWNMTDEAREAGVVWVNHIKARQYEPFDFPMSIELNFGRFGNYGGEIQSSSSNANNKFSKAADHSKKMFEEEAEDDFWGDNEDDEQLKKKKNKKKNPRIRKGNKTKITEDKSQEKPQDKLLDNISVGSGDLKISFSELIKARSNAQACILMDDDDDLDEISVKPRKNKKSKNKKSKNKKSKKEDLAF